MFYRQQYKLNICNMDSLELNIQGEWNAVVNILRMKREGMNGCIDAIRKAKKLKDREAEQYSKLKKAKLAREIQQLEEKRVKLEDEFDMLSRKLGTIRLKTYVLSEALYDNLVAYKAFVEKHCTTMHAEDAEIIDTAIKYISKLPFEAGSSDNDRFRNIYNAIADRFIERNNDVIDAIFEQTVTEIEKNKNLK